MLCGAVLAFLGSVALDAQQPSGSLVGRVAVTTGDLQGAQASLPNLGRRVAVSPSGEFRFDDLPAGEHVLVVDSPSAGRAVRTVVVPAGEVASIELTLSRA
ncbi:MAG TPA: carboxypeptidase-like regulatory domain-containing protein, partial [Thermoanaerobaculia bacterium]|nr:carboxypeptidase-like regulatory domain-containing protein [Thermoanaerobaculia bacterium]